MPYTSSSSSKLKQGHENSTQRSNVASCHVGIELRTRRSRSPLALNWRARVLQARPTAPVLPERAPCWCCLGLAGYLASEAYINHPNPCPGSSRVPVPASPPSLPLFPWRFSRSRDARAAGARTGRGRDDGEGDGQERRGSSRRRREGRLRAGARADRCVRACASSLPLPLRSPPMFREIFCIGRDRSKASAVLAAPGC
jgi:hypothetical protein